MRNIDSRLPLATQEKFGATRFRIRQLRILYPFLSFSQPARARSPPPTERVADLGMPRECCVAGLNLNHRLRF
jgi:hypothetical protein